MKQLPQPVEFGLPENVEEAYLAEKKKYELNRSNYSVAQLAEGM